MVAVATAVNCPRVLSGRWYLSRKLKPERWGLVKPLLRALLERARPVVVHFSWRPSSPDPGDEHVIDGAMNAGALVVTLNVRDFKRAQDQLGLPVVTPVDFLKRLRAGE